MRDVILAAADVIVHNESKMRYANWKLEKHKTN